MEKQTFKRGELIQSPNEIKNSVYYVESGLLRSYAIDEQGKEHIYAFAPENWIIGDALTSLLLASELYIDAVEDSVVKLISNEDPRLKDPSKLLRRVAVLQKRIVQLMSASAIERYEEFIATYPDIVQRVPQKMIASYLGITPEALSTVKRRYWKDKT